MKKIKAPVKLRSVSVAFAIVLLAGCGSSSTLDEFLEEDDDDETDITIIEETDNNSSETIDTEVIASAINTPDIQGGSDYYRNPVNSALLSGPLVGANSGSERVFSRSIPFNQVAADRPIRVQRVVGSNYIDDGDEQFIMIFTVKNITSSVVCGSTFNFRLHRADDSTGGLNPNADFKETWHGEPVDVLEESSFITFDLKYRSCIQPNSSSYISRRVLPSMTLEDLARVDISRPAFENLESDNDFIATVEQGSSVVIPTAYTIGSLPETDSRVRTGADDEFVKVSVVNNSPTVQDMNSAVMILMGPDGFPVARTSTIFTGFSFQEQILVQPGAEYEFIFRNNIDVGDVSSMRVIVNAEPADLDNEV